MPRPQSPSEVPARPTTILIVEDEPLVRLFAVDILGDAGFGCVEAPTGREALEALTSAPETFAAALVDFVLPDQSGNEVALEFLRLCPALPVLIVSGRAEAEIRQRMGGHPVSVLSKPYTGTMLLQALAKMGVAAP